MKKGEQVKRKEASERGISMARNKHMCRKNRLIRAGKENSPVPLWVVAKTRGKFRRHPKIRNWRRNKLKL